MKIIRKATSFLLIVLLVTIQCVISISAATAKSEAYVYDNYSVYYNSDMTTSWSTLKGYLNTAETLLNNNFGINLDRLYASSSSSLNQRAGCSKADSSICTSTCGTLSNCKTTHHKAASHFLYVAEAGDAKIFRYVDYAICKYSSSNHRKVNGVATGDDSDIIVSLCSDNVQRTTVHELSHWYGAQDSQCVDGQSCVMRYGSTVYNQWCDNCEDDIESYLLGY